MFVQKKSTVKMANGNTVHAQIIGIILCRFHNCTIIYPVGSVYYFPVHHSNTISSGDFKFYVGSQKVTSDPIEHCEFVDNQGRSWILPYQTQKTFRLSSNRNSESEPSNKQEYFSQLSVTYKNRIYLSLFISNLVISLSTG